MAQLRDGDQAAVRNGSAPSISVGARRRRKFQGPLNLKP